MVITLPNGLEQQLVDVAHRMQRDPQDLAREGLATFLAEQAAALEEHAQIAAGEAALAAGRLRPWEEIAAELVADGALPADWRARTLDDLLGPEEA